MANYNFLREAKVYLVDGGSSATTAANYPTSGLVHRFRLDNATTGISDDVDSNTATAVTNGTVTFSSTNLFPGFDGSFLSTYNNGIRLMTAAEANAWEDENSAFTVSLWFQSTAEGGGSGTQNRIISRDFSEGFGLHLDQSASSGSQVLKLIGEPNNTNITTTLTTNTWHNVVITWNGTNVQAYLNGSASGSAVGYTRTATAGGLCVGQNIEADTLQNSPGLRGLISNLQLFNRVLTAAEILAIYDHTTGANTTTLEVSPELTFGQTFTDTTTEVKTLHSQDFFEKSNIKKANPANFQFTIPVFKEDDIAVVHSRLLDCATFDLYISTQQDVFKLQKSVITNGTYEIERSTPLTLAVSGQASKLSKVGENSSYTVPGTVQSSTANRTYLMTTEITNTLNGSDISSETVSIAAELQNDIKWTPHTTVQGGISTTDRSNIQFPENFTIDKKTFSGSIVRYLCDTNNSLVNDFDETATLRIKAGQTIDGSFFGFDFNMPACSFTNRSSVAEVFTQSYDWTLTDNSQALSTTITYNNI